MDRKNAVTTLSAGVGTFCMRGEKANSIRRRAQPNVSRRRHLLLWAQTRLAMAAIGFAVAALFTACISDVAAQPQPLPTASFDMLNSPPDVPIEVMIGATIRTAHRAGKPHEYKRSPSILLWVNRKNRKQDVIIFACCR